MTPRSVAPLFWRESQLPPTPPGGTAAHGIASASYALDGARWEPAST
jgi:hypothetical protein